MRARAHANRIFKSAKVKDDKIGIAVLKCALQKTFCVNGIVIKKVISAES